MEENITKFNKNIANFCNNLQSTTSAFKQSLDRRPIPLDSASTTFMQSLNRRVSALTGDLNLLESMSLGTVSFEELLGHCNEIYKLNHQNLLNLHSHLKSLSYISPSDGLDDLAEDFMAQSSSTSPEPESPFPNFRYGSNTNNVDAGSLFEESPSFRNLGLSEISLATLASGGVRKHDVLDSPPKSHTLEVRNKDAASILNAVGGKSGEERYESNLCETSNLILVSSEDYNSLPSYMKSVAPWKDLQSAVEKMNSFLSKKGNAKQNFFHPEELESMGLGTKGRSYVLLLVRMKRLNVETNNGLISYRVL